MIEPSLVILTLRSPPQDFPLANVSIVVVDNGSKHEPDYAAAERRMRAAGVANFSVVRQGRNTYPGAARNACVRHTRTDWVAFLDDDDVPRVTWLSTMLAVAVRTEADVVTCQVGCRVPRGAGRLNSVGRPTFSRAPTFRCRAGRPRCDGFRWATLRTLGFGTTCSAPTPRSFAFRPSAKREDSRRTK